MPSSNKSSALARRAKRCAAEPSRVSSIRSCRDSLSRKLGRITRSAESRSHALASDSFGFPQSQGIVLVRRKEAAVVVCDIARVEHPIRRRRKNRLICTVLGTVVAETLQAIQNQAQVQHLVVRT